MATQISVKILQQEIEKQKNIALHTPVQVWADSSNAARVNGICSKYSAITQNPNLFDVHTFSASTNPYTFVQDMANCFPRVLMVALAKLNDPQVNVWVRQQFPLIAKKLPFVDIRYINIQSLKPIVNISNHLVP